MSSVPLVHLRYEYFRTAPYPTSEARNSQSAANKKPSRSSTLDENIIIPSAEKTGSRDSSDSSKKGSGRSGEEQAEKSFGQ